MGKRQDLMFKFIILAVVSYPIFYNSDNTVITVIFSFLFGVGVIGAIGGAFSSDNDFEE